MTGALGIPPWFWHPDRTGDCTAHAHAGCGYQAWSGWVSDISEVSLLFAILSAVVVAGKHLNCHEPGCLLMGRHNHHASGTRWCRKHMPDDLRAAHPKPHVLERERWWR